MHHRSPGVAARRAAFAVLTAALVSGPPAVSRAAGPYTWNGDTTGDWSTPANWAGANAPPPGGGTAATDVVNFNGTAGYTANNDLAGVFQLNQLAFNNTGGPTQTVTLTGNEIRFGGTTPVLTVAATSASNVTVGNNLSLAIASTWTNGGTGLLTLNGTVTGTNSALTLAGTGNTTFGNGAAVDLGTAQLSVTNTGTTTFGTAANTIGSVSLNGATVVLGSNTSLGAGLITTTTATPTIQASTPLTGLTNNVTLSSNVTFAGANPIAFTGGAITVSATTRTLTSSIAGGALTLNNINLSISTSARTLILAGTGNTIVNGGISNGAAATGNLTVSNTGTTTLNAVNTYNGTTTLSGAGTVVIGNTDPFGNSAGLVTVTADGLTIQSALPTATIPNTTLQLVANPTFSGANSIVVAGNTSISSASRVVTNSIAGGGLLTLQGGVTTANTSATRTFTLTGSGDTLISGAISQATGGVGLFTNTSSGTTTLTGVNTYTGATTLGGTGTTVVSGAGVFGNTAVTLSNGTLSLQKAGAVSQGSLTVGGGTYVQAVANAVSGTAALTVSNPGTTSLPLANNHSGGSTLTGSATVVLGDPAALGSGTILFGTAFLQASTPVTLPNAVTISSTTTATVSGSNSITLSGVVSTSGDRTLANAITGAGNSLTLGSAVNPISITTSTAARTLTLTGTGTTTVAGALSQFAGSVGTFAYTGTGVLNLTAANTYTGATTLSGGGTTVVTGAFGDTTVNLSNGTLSLQATGAYSPTVAKTLTVSGAGVLTQTAANAVGGMAGLTFTTAAATHTLPFANAYTGATTITGAGNTFVLASNAFGAATPGQVVITGGTTIQGSSPTTTLPNVFFLNGASGVDLVVSGTNSVSLGGVTLGTASHSITNSLPGGQLLTIGASSLNTTATRTLSILGPGDTAVGALSQGTSNASFTNGGSGTVTLTGANTYAGATTLSGAGTTVVTGAFGDTTVNLSSGTLSLQSALAYNPTVAKTLTVSGTGVLTPAVANAIGGLAGLTFTTAAATHTLPFANAYTGATTLGGADNTFVLASNAFGTATPGQVVMPGATTLQGSTAPTTVLPNVFVLSGATGVDLVVSGTRSVTLGGVTLQNASHSITNSLPGGQLLTIGASSLNTTATRTLSILGPGDTAVGALSQGTSNASFTNGGSGTVTLTGANTYAGATTLSGAGTTVVTGAFGNTAIALSNGTLSLQSVGAVSQNKITVTGGTLTQTVDNAIGGTTAFAVAGTGAAVTLSRPNNNSGTVDVGGTNATLTLTNTAAAGTGRLGVITGSTGGVINLRFDGGGSNGTIPLTNQLLVNSGVTGTVDVNNNGGGTTGNQVQFNGANTGYGNGTLNVTGGNNYRLLIASLTPSAGADGSLTFNPTTAGLTIGSVTPSGTFAYTLALDGTRADGAVTGVISTGTAASLAVSKTNVGTWSLSGNNTYAGGTTVSAGTLRANNAGGPGTSATGTGPVLVSGGGTLGGTGTITPAADANVTIQGTVAPGNSVGTLNVAVSGTGVVTVPGVFAFELGTAGLPVDPVTAPGGSTTGPPAAVHDQLLVTGPLDVTGMSATAAAGGSGFDPAQSYSWTIATATSVTTTGPLGAVTSVSGDFLTAPGGTAGFSLSVDSTRVFLNYAPVVVPEPTTVGLLAAAGLGLSRLVRRGVRRS